MEQLIEHLRADARRFVGMKDVFAASMTRGEYNRMRGWKTPADENPDDPGYLVEYLDGGPANVPAVSNNYVSWSPAGVFNRAYWEVKGMTFSAALEKVKRGSKMTRKGWNGVGMFIFLVPGSRFEVNRPPLLGIYPEGTQIDYHGHIDMRTANGVIVPWVASQADLLAEDWSEIFTGPVNEIEPGEQEDEKPMRRSETPDPLTYREPFDYVQAMIFMSEGKAVKRKRWRKGSYVFQMPESIVKPEKPEKLPSFMDPHVVGMVYPVHFVERGGPAHARYYRPWSPNEGDHEANDWYLVPDDEAS